MNKYLSIVINGEVVVRGYSCVNGMDKSLIHV